jgi:hypothetical protein
MPSIRSAPDLAFERDGLGVAPRPARLLHGVLLGLELASRPPDRLDDLGEDAVERLRRGLQALEAAPLIFRPAFATIAATCRVASSAGLASRLLDARRVHLGEQVRLELVEVLGDERLLRLDRQRPGRSRRSRRSRPERVLERVHQESHERILELLAGDDLGERLDLRDGLPLAEQRVGRLLQPGRRPRPSSTRRRRPWRSPRRWSSSNPPRRASAPRAARVGALVDERHPRDRHVGQLLVTRTPSCPEPQTLNAPSSPLTIAAQISGSG